MAIGSENIAAEMICTNELLQHLESNVTESGSDFKSIDVEGAYSHTLKIPIEWEFSELKNIIEIVGGSQPPKSEFKSESGKDLIRLIQIRDYKSDKHLVYIPTEKAKRFVSKDDVMIGRYGPPIFQILRGLEGAYNVALMKAVPVSGVMNNEYLFHYLNGRDIYNYVESASDRTAGQSGVNKAHLEKYPVGLPPLAEQAVIAHTLDALLAQVDNIKIRLDGIPKILKTFRQSVLAAAVSGKLTEEWRGENGGEVWRNSVFENLLEEMRNGLSPKPNEDGIGYPIFRISAVRPQMINYSDMRYLECDEKIADRYRLQKNDLLFTRYNGSIDFVGVCGMIKQEPAGIILYPDKLIRVRLKKDINPSYIDVYFASPTIRKLVTDFVKSTSGQKGISGKDLKSVVIALPSMEEQAKIVRRVEELFAFADQIEQQVKNAQGRVNSLTQSILAKAFRGEFTTQWRADNPDLISGDNSAQALLAAIQKEHEKLKPVKKAKAKQTKKVLV
ncbi:MAG: restriction endonuclease subunit S [Colwellia sp.]|jgi:Restriction endonuclease S subunits